MITPSQETLRRNFNETDKKGNNGLWPAYIFNYGLTCNQIKYFITVKPVKKVDEYDINGDHDDIKKLNLTCEWNEYFRSIQHFVTVDQGKYLYDLYFNDRSENEKVRLYVH